VLNSAIYLNASYAFCKQVILLCNKPTTTAVSSVCGSKGS